MANFRYPMTSLFFSILFSLGIGLLSISCSGSEKKEENPASDRQPLEAVPAPGEKGPEKPELLPDGTETAPAPALTSMGGYEKIMEDAAMIDLNYRELKEKTAKFLEIDVPQNELEKEKCMMIALVAAGAFYLDDDLTKAQGYAQNAFLYAKDGAIQFPPCWDLERLKDKETVMLMKIIKMKDFLLSVSDEGVASFQKANKAFVDQARYKEAMEFYHNALYRGIRNDEWRKQCYVRLASCLFKAGDLKESDKMFRHAWLLDRGIELTFGDQATKDFLNEMKGKYEAEYGK